MTDCVMFDMLWRWVLIRAADRASTSVVTVRSDWLETKFTEPGVLAVTLVWFCSELVASRPWLRLSFFLSSC